MLDRAILFALLGLLATTWAAPTLLHANEVRSATPPGCVGWVWELVQICVLSPPTTTIGPSTRRDGHVISERDTISSQASVWVGKRDEPEHLAERDSTVPTRTLPADCIPLILEEFDICISPPTTTIGPSTKKAKRDWIWLGPPTVGGIVPDETVPTGALVPDDYAPGGALEPDSTVPGGRLAPSN